MQYKRKPRTLPLLRAMRDDSDLAALFAVPMDELVKTLKMAQRMYIRIPYKKKDGTPRIIRAPKEELKIIQRAILDVFLMRVRLPKCVYGFSAGRGIVENARLHAKSRYMLNIDIRDFFPSVHKDRVERLFLELGASPDVATTLTRLTTLEHSLPQGAPSSPYIAALALDELDRRITGLCASNRLTYSRYFDDITISGGSRAHQVKDLAVRIITACGFEAHTREDKLRMYGPGETRLITGIQVMNGDLSVPNTDDLAKYLEELKVCGISALRSDSPLKEKLSLRGKVVFLTQVNPGLGRSFAREFEKINWGV